VAVLDELGRANSVRAGTRISATMNRPVNRPTRSPIGPCSRIS